MMTRPPSANAANRQTSPRHGLAPTLVCLALLLASAASGAVTGNWAVDADGTWNTPTNWSSNPSIPNAAGDTANLTYNIAASRTVTLDVPVTVGYLTMEDLTTVNADWILIGSNALTMDTGSAANATLTVSSRTLNRIDTDMVLNSNVTLTVGQGVGLTINGDTSGAGGFLNTGRGAIDLYGNNTFLGDFTTYTADYASRLGIGSDTALGQGTVHLRGKPVEALGAARSLANSLSLEGDFVVQGSYNLAFAGAATLTGNRTITVNNDTFALAGGVGENAAGRALAKAGAGWLVIGGTSSYSGATTISAGVLRASDGAGLPTASLLQIRGGVLEMSGAFTRTLGTAAGNVNWDAASSGGFSAYGGAATVNLNGGGADNLAWGSTPSFIGNGAVLQFGSTKSDNVLTFVDNIGLGADAGAVRQINVTDNTASAADKTILSGVLSGTGILRKAGTGQLELSGANTFSGQVAVVQGQLALASTGSLSGATQLSLIGGSELRVNGDTAAHTDQAMQTLDATDGEAVVTVAPGAGFGARLTFSDLDRAAPGTLLLRGPGLGSAAYPAANVGNLAFTDASGFELVGGGGGAGTTTISICPFARGDASASGAGADLVTYDATTGVRPLDSGAGEYATTITSGQTQLDNVRLSGAATVNGTATINALVLDNGGSLAGTSALTVNSGAVLALAGNGGISKPLDFGGREGVLHAAGAATTATISSALSGSAGITKAGPGMLSLSSTAQAFSGAVTVSAGVLDLASGAVLSNLYPPVDVHVAQGATLRFPNNLYVGALEGNGLINGTTSNNIFRFGCDNSDSTFAGSFLQAGGTPDGPGVDKLGKGTATITAPLGTLGSWLGVTDGTLRMYDNGSSPAGTRVYGGATLLFDDTGTHVDNRTQSTYVGGEYKVLGSLSANTAAGGPANTQFQFTLLGNPTLTLVPGTGFEAQYRQRNGGDNNMCGVGPEVTAFVRGDGLAQASGTRSRFTIQSQNFNTVLIGGAGQVMADSVAPNPPGQAGTPQVSVIYRMYGDNSSTGLGSGFVTYDRGPDHQQDDDDPGVRLLTASEYATTLADGAGGVLSTIANTKLSTAVAGINSATRVNTLLLEDNGSVSGAGMLTVESGLIMSTGSNGAIDAAGLATGTGGAVRLITPEATDQLTVSSAIGSGVTAGLIKSGEGTAVLTGTNAYSGTTYLANGALRATDGVSLPANSTVHFTGGVLEGAGTFTRSLGTGGANVRWDEHNSGGFAANGGVFNIQLNGGTGAVTWDNTAYFVQGHRNLILGSATADNVVALQNALALGTFDVASGDRTDNTFRTIEVIDNPNSTTDLARLSGAVTGTDARLTLVKTGDGTLELAGPNTYSIATTVAEGTLLVTSSTGSGPVEVNDGATLAGSGTVTGATTVAAGGALAPGAGPGILTLNGGLTLAEEATLAVELGGATPGLYDQANVTGAVSLGTGAAGTELILTLYGGFSPAAFDQFVIVENDGTDAVAGLLSYGGTLLGEGDMLAGAPGGKKIAISYLYDSATGLIGAGNDILLQVIPEPGTAAALGVGLLAALRRRRPPRVA